MQHKSALVTGATGLLGRQVVRALTRSGWTVTGTGHSRAHPPETIKLDLTSEIDLRQTLQHLKPSLLVHCAAERAPDRVDGDPEAAKRLNVAVSGRLAGLCAEMGVFVVYISSDYVFAGRKGEAPYGIDALPSPPNLYGETKLAGEKAVLDRLRSQRLAVSLRIPVLYGEGEVAESSINVLQEAVYAAAETRGQDAKGVDDWSIRYPTNTEDVARVVKDIAELYLSKQTAEQRKHLPELLHFSSEDRLTKYKICELFAEILGLPVEGLRPDSAEPRLAPGQAQRPYDCHLDTSRLKELGISVATQDFAGWWKRRMGAFRH